jgi:hypothetical protein
MRSILQDLFDNQPGYRTSPMNRFFVKGSLDGLGLDVVSTAKDDLGYKIAYTWRF